MRRNLIGWAFFCLALYGCATPLTPTGPPRQCEQVWAIKIRELLLSHLPPEDVRAEIAAIYELPIDEVRESNAGFEWNSDGTRGALLTPDYALLAQTFYERAPSAGMVLGCLGAPDAYGAWYSGTADGQPLLSLDLYYVQKGIRVQAVQSGARGHPPPLDGTTPVLSLIYLEPALTETMWERLKEGVPDKWESTIKPWPGSWDKIEVDIEPSAR